MTQKEPPYREGEHTQILLMAQDIKYVKQSVDEIKQSVKQDYVTRTEYQAELAPLKKIVYGLVGLILTAVVAAVMSMIVRTQ